MKKGVLWALAGVAYVQLSLTPVSAQSEQLGTCLVQNTTGKQRIAMAQWIALAVVSHPSIRDKVAIPNEVIETTDVSMGSIFTELITQTCREEARAVASLDGQAVEAAFESAFRALGEVAMQELMIDRNVTTRMNGFLNHVDEDALERVFE